MALFVVQCHKLIQPETRLGELELEDRDKALETPSRTCQWPGELFQNWASMCTSRRATNTGSNRQNSVLSESWFWWIGTEAVPWHWLIGTCSAISDVSRKKRASWMGDTSSFGCRNFELPGAISDEHAMQDSSNEIYNRGRAMELVSRPNLEFCAWSLMLIIFCKLL